MARQPGLPGRHRSRVDDAQGSDLRHGRQRRRQRVPADRALPPRSRAPRVDGLAARPDLGRQRGGHDGGHRSAARLADRRGSRAWRSPAWAWTACRSTRPGSGSIPSSAGTALARSRSSTGGSRTSARRRPSRIGGNTLWRFSTALRLLWMAEHEPEILARTDKWLLIEDFVNLMLCGKMATDYTMASCTLLFDQRKLDWSDEMLGLVRHRQAAACPGVSSGHPLGRGDREGRGAKPASPSARRWCSAATITCAARCRSARSGPA